MKFGNSNSNIPRFGRSKRFKFFENLNNLPEIAGTNNRKSMGHPDRTYRLWNFDYAKYSFYPKYMFNQDISVLIQLK